MSDGPSYDVLIQWDGGDEVNVVSISDLQLVAPTSTWETGGKVKMWWAKTGSWFFGTILDSEVPVSDDSDEDDMPLAAVVKRSEESDDDLPLSTFISAPVLTELTTVPFEAIASPSHETSRQPVDAPPEHADALSQRCAVQDCGVEIFAACGNSNCQVLLCFDHFESTCPICTPEPLEASPAPEAFFVDGLPREEAAQDHPQQFKTTSQRKVVKHCRNRGLPYTTEKSKVNKPGKSTKSQRCSDEKFCTSRGFQCCEVSEERREEILIRYYSMGSLQEERHWIKSHIKLCQPMTVRTKNSRKSRTIRYFLPSGDGHQLQVCRPMFLNTLSISEKQVRTVLAKTTDGVVEEEKRGGRVNTLKERDQRLREEVRNHIDRFPRMESHYCRQNTSYQYLSPELNQRKMYDMYVTENPANHGSYALYSRVFNSMKLKFHVPKKDMCGLCATYRLAEKGGTPENALSTAFASHTSEKLKIREIKLSLKNEKNPSTCLACFDLEQVLYLPKSNRCEIFYRRRLSCYNFTVYDIQSKECHCYIWHEGVALRGANEIASNLAHFLESVDKNHTSNVHLFSDSCSGQNRNTILPAMFLQFVQRASHVKEITHYFFEPHHGQNEGDSVHSCVERAMERVPEIMVPSQLVTIIQLSRRHPNHVITVNTSDILDWKKLSTDIGILRRRTAENGTEIDWTKVRQVHVNRQYPLKLAFKMSHHDTQWSWLDLTDRRQHQQVGDLVLDVPNRAYRNAPKLSAEKYNDLEQLMNTAVISQPEHKLFYRNLPH